MRVWIDGAYYDESEAKVSVFDHGLLYGDGAFEGIRVYSGEAFKLGRHLDRLFDSARAIALEPPYGKEELAAAVRDAIRENGTSDGYIRLVLTRGKGDLGVNPRLCPRPSVIIIVGEIAIYPERCYAEGISLVTSSLRRVPVDCFDVRVKSLNYLNNVLAKVEAQNAGCFEALMLNSQGFVAECTVDNAFAVKRGVLMTPPESEGALLGITRETVLEIARDSGIPCQERRLGQFDLYTADECFITGTGAEIMSVTKIDGRLIGEGRPGPLTMQLLKLFRDRVREGKAMTAAL
jgi:branched-chain amino acid aminotransferase